MKIIELHVGPLWAQRRQTRWSQQPRDGLLPSRRVLEISGLEQDMAPFPAVLCGRLCSGLGNFKRGKEQNSQLHSGPETWSCSVVRACVTPPPGAPFSRGDTMPLPPSERVPSVLRCRPPNLSPRGLSLGPVQFATRNRLIMWLEEFKSYWFICFW